VKTIKDSVTMQTKKSRWVLALASHTARAEFSKTRAGFLLGQASMLILEFA